jgi:hypothetical protein
LNILISKKSLWLQTGSSGGTSLVCLKYNDSVGHSRRDESQSVRESCPGGRSVELDGSKGIAKGAEEEQEMSMQKSLSVNAHRLTETPIWLGGGGVFPNIPNEPAKLQGLGDSQNSLLQRLVVISCGRSHFVFLSADAL